MHLAMTQQLHLDIHPTKISSYIHEKTSRRRFPAALFINNLKSGMAQVHTTVDMYDNIDVQMDTYISTDNTDGSEDTLLNWNARHERIHTLLSHWYEVQEQAKLSYSIRNKDYRCL